MLLDFPGIFLYLFSFLPSPVALMMLGIIAFTAFIFVMNFVTRIKDLIPFI